MAFWTLLIFLILLGVLWKMGWPAILKSVEEREQRVGEAREGRVVVPAAHEAGPRHVGNVEDDGAAVEVSDPGSVGPR